jgi:hypothetical protein
LLPNTVLAGVVLLVLGLTRNKFEGVWRDGGMDVAFTDQSWVARRFRRAGWGAFTLGCFMFFWGEDQADRPELRVHERHHVYQQLLWGPLWGPVYLLLLVVSFVRKRSWMDGYVAHPFERAARLATRKWLDSKTG